MIAGGLDMMYSPPGITLDTNDLSCHERPLGRTIHAGRIDGKRMERAVIEPFLPADKPPAPRPGHSAAARPPA